MKSNEADTNTEIIMKKLTGLVVLLAALVLGSYYGMGYLTEKKLKESLALVSQSNGVTASVGSYNRGWFKSQAVINWGLHLPEHTTTSPSGQVQTIPATDLDMQLPVTIYHGPFIFANNEPRFGLGYAETSVDMPEKYIKDFNEAFTDQSTKPKLNLSLFVNYFNTASLDLGVPAFKLFLKQGGEFDWLGMTSSTEISSNLDSVEGNVTVEGLNVAKDQMKTTMGTVTSEYNLHKSDLGFYLGDGSFSFPSLVVTNNGVKLFEISQLDTHSDANIDAGLFNTHFKASVEKIIANDKNYGPGNIDIALRNLDAVVLAKLNDQLNQAQQVSDLERQKIMLSMLPELPKLFSKGPEFEIRELSMVMPQGTIDGNLMISLPKADAGNPFELIQKIQGKGKLRIPAEVVKMLLTESIKQKLMAPQQPAQAIQDGIVQQMQQQQAAPAAGTDTTATPAPTPAPAAPTASADIMQQAANTADQQLQAMVASGVLTQQGTDYLIELNLDKGQLSVNGKPFNPAMIKFQ